jgi:hypothetical protein
MNPASVLSYPQVNGAKCSFCSIELKLGAGSGIAMPGIKAISYKEALEFGKVFGTSPTVQGTTRGRLEATGSIEVYRDQFDALLEVLTAAGLWGYTEKRFPLTVTYAEVGAFQTQEDFLPFVKLHSPDTSNQEGTDATTVKMEMHIMPQIVWHGSSTPRVALSNAASITSNLTG